MSDSGDNHWMARCLELAAQARGKTAPNPMVGCVIVRDGALVGEGFHPGAGEPHAEVFALRTAGELARGATLYVNLEPCNHQGRTPPCTEAILQSDVQRVVVGMQDPNPLVSGRGIARLRAAGLDVSTDVLNEACRELNEAFSHFITTGRPFGIFKYAMTLDGKIATHTGHSFWVSGEAARTYVHHLRAGCDAVIVGGNTVRRDDPQLTVRLSPGRNPLRVVLSRRLELPSTARLWQQQVAPTLVFTEPCADPEMHAHLKHLGIEVQVLPELVPHAVMTVLARRGCLSVLWECGGSLAWAALIGGAVQKVVAFVAPVLAGGSTAPTPLGGIGFERMDTALRLQRVSARAVGEDWMVCGYVDELRAVVSLTDHPPRTD